MDGLYKEKRDSPAAGAAAFRAEQALSWPWAVCAPRQHRPIPVPWPGAGMWSRIQGDPDTEPCLLPLQNGVISLIDCTLVEEPESTDEDGRNPHVGQSPQGTWNHRTMKWFGLKGPESSSSSHSLPRAGTPSASSGSTGPHQRPLARVLGSLLAHGTRAVLALPVCSKTGTLCSMNLSHPDHRQPTKCSKPQHTVCVFSIPKQKHQGKTSTTLTSKLWWSPKIPPLSPLSSWPRPGRRRLRGPVTSAR